MVMAFANVEVAVVEVAIKNPPRIVEVEDRVFVPVQSVIMPFNPEPEREDVLQVEHVSASVPPKGIVPAPPSGEAVVTTIEELARKLSAIVEVEITWSFASVARSL